LDGLNDILAERPSGERVTEPDPEGLKDSLEDRSQLTVTESDGELEKEAEADPS